MNRKTALFFLLIISVLFQNCKEVSSLGGKVASEEKTEIANLVLSENLVTSLGSSKIGKSVLDFGAIGDGVADDTGAFAAAITEGGYIYVPGGKTYKIRHTINIEKPTVITSDGTATLKFVNDAALIIHSSQTSIRNIKVDASALSLQPEARCTFYVNNNNPNLARMPDWMRGITIADVELLGAPCIVRDLVVPAKFADKSSIVGLYLDNIKSMQARGPQISFKSAFAYVFFRDIHIKADVEVNKPFVRLERNQGASLSGIKIEAVGGAAESDGIALVNFAAVWISDVLVKGVGGSGIKASQIYSGLGPNQGLYISNTTLIDNGELGIDAPNTLMLLTRNLNWANNSGGGGNFTGSTFNQHTNTSPAWWHESSRSYLSETRLRSPHSGTYVSVSDFGAKGDGVTDDSDAFQAAIDSGYNVFVPQSEGTASYLLTKTVKLNRPVSLVGVEGSTFLISAAQKVFEVTSSNVIVQGLDIKSQSNAPDDATAFWLNAQSHPLEQLRFLNVSTESMGYSVSNLNASNNEISDLLIRHLPVEFIKKTALHLTNVKNSSFDRILGDLPDVAPSKPFIVFNQSDALQLIDSSALQGNKWAPDAAAPTVLIESSSNIDVSRWMSDGTNSFGFWINNSERVYLSESSLKTDMASFMIRGDSKLIYGVNTLMHSANPNKPEEFFILDSDTIAFIGVLDYLGAMGVVNTNSQNVLFSKYTTRK